MRYEKVFIKYSASFVAAVTSKPDLNAYSGHFLAKELHGDTCPVHTEQVRETGPAVGLLQVGDKSKHLPRAVGTETVKWGATAKPTASRS